MKIPIPHLLASLLLLRPSPARSISSRTPEHRHQLVVHTSSGKIHGKIDPANPNVRQFLGIPYAQSPLGDLRFAPPRPLDANASRQHVEATELPPSCLQYLGTSPSVYVDNVLEFNLQGLNTTGSVSEDCLTLSVWTPTLAASSNSSKGCDASASNSGSNATSTLLPVLIFIYGGGFSTGGQNVPYQIPTQWIQRSPTHLVVSFNYRINLWGFPGAAGLSASDQNAGLLDQRAAVEWIRDNIAAFGGDPARMTLWGQSAGAYSVDYYGFAYPDDPIVTGLIMDSGSALSRNASSAGVTARASFEAVAAQFGCGSSNSSADADAAAKQLACMRTLNSSAVESFVATHSNAGQSPSLSWGPLANNVSAFANYTRRALAGNLAHIPAIIGTNAQDGVPFATYNADGPDTTAALRAGLSTFFCPATETARLRITQGVPVYRYYYGGNFSNISPTDWLGAYHSSELPLLMGTYGNYRGESSEMEGQTSGAFQDAYLQFAASGGVEGTGWMRYEGLGDGTVRNFGNATAGPGPGPVPVQDIDVRWLERLCNGATLAS